MTAPDNLAILEHKLPERVGPWANLIEGETSLPYDSFRA